MKAKPDRKEAIREYKQTPRPMGIYRIRNEKNGRILIGSARDLRGKLNRYRFQLENGSHPNRDLQREFLEVGADAYSFEVLDYLDPDETRQEDHDEALSVLERLWIEKLQPYAEKGYHKRI